MHIYTPQLRACRVKPATGHNSLGSHKTMNGALGYLTDLTDLAYLTYLNPSKCPSKRSGLMQLRRGYTHRLHESGVE